MCHCPTYKPLIDLFAHKIKWTDQPNIQGFPFHTRLNLSFQHYFLLQLQVTCLFAAPKYIFQFSASLPFLMLFT